MTKMVEKRDDVVDIVDMNTIS